MISDALVLQDLIISPDGGNLFLSADAQKWEDREHNQFLSLTAVLLRTDVVYVLANSTTLTTSLVGRLDARLQRLSFVCVSPTLRQVLCVNVKPQCAIVSVSKFLISSDRKQLPP